MLKLNIKTPRRYINPLLSKKPVKNSDFDSFRKNLNRYKIKIREQHEKGQSEQNIVTNALKPFFESMGYDARPHSQKGQSGIDLAIFKGDHLCVIIEAKKYQSAGMITKEDPNKQAFYEVVLYFMRERNKGNTAISSIIITDFFNWFVFDAKDFDRLFWKNKIVKKLFDNYNNPKELGDTTKDFYEPLGEVLRGENFEGEIDCAYFNLKEPQDDKNLIAIYKLVGADSLLKEFNPNDANTLNEDFYSELLYILGLEEVEAGSKKIIQRAKYPQAGSIYENIATKLSQYHIDQDFELIIKLIIVWINRILFLKLLESQLVRWNNNNREYKFLNKDKINDFDDLEMLFFEVLAKKREDRRDEKFNYIPYLNSSLFELDEVEKKYLKISNLENNLEITYYPETVIRDDRLRRKTGSVKTLHYLFEFLDAYDFSATSEDELVKDDKTLINASVLGLLFEKLNGYRDGSYYTPSFITSYMAKETITKAVIDKFNRIKGWEAKTITDIYNNIKNNIEDIKEANNIIDSLTICDPAVGSGHFLVSALNVLLALKSELDILVDEDGRKIKDYTILVENDELIIKDEYGNIFDYKRDSKEKTRIQKTLFKEKQKIIENQLFGVDINPISVNICRLRLWIELLKNAYYKEDDTLETLPNIDINIKCGNSLISRFGLTDELKIENIKDEIEYYKKVVTDYKENKGSKKEILKSIENLKEKFKSTLKAEWKVVQARNIKLKEYVSKYEYEGLDDDLVLIAIKKKYKQAGTLFGDLDEEKRLMLKKELTDLQAQCDEMENGKIYDNAFEWRFEFPEVLDDNGEFIGFDIVIGNPPYIMEDDNRSAFDGLRDKPCYQGKTDIWHLFTCQGLSILKQNGFISYIAKNQWLESQSASKMRKTIYQNGNILSIIDFGVNMIFEEAGQQTMIFLIQKDNENKEHLISYKKYITKISNENIAKLLYKSQDENLKTITKRIIKNYDENANLTFSNSQNEEILQKIESFKNFEFDQKEIIQGIIGGPDEAFIINEDELDNYTQNEKVYLKMLHTNTGKYFTNDTKQYIFYISAKNFKDKNIDDYPNIKNHFESYKEDLIQRKINYKTPSKPYFYLHRERDESFFKEGDKIVWAKRTEGAKFTFTTEPFYGTANLFFIKSNRVNLRYIVALLNSKLMYFYMRERLKHTGDLLQIDKNQFIKIPLFVCEKQQPFIELVDKILELKKSGSDTSELEREIDDMVYKLYNLTQEEIDIIEGVK